MFHVLEDFGVFWLLNLCLGSLGYLIILLLLQAIPKDMLFAILLKRTAKV
jgi:hypothetical protein